MEERKYSFRIGPEKVATDLSECTGCLDTIYGPMNVIVVRDERGPQYLDIKLCDSCAEGFVKDLFQE